MKNRYFAASGLAAATLLVPIMPVPTDASPGDKCLITDPTSTCVNAAEGAVDVYLSERIPRSGSPASASGLATDPELSSATNAFCRDQLSESARNTSTATPPIETLCGLLPVAGVVAGVPGRVEVLAAFRELGLYRGAVRSDPGRASFVNLETYFWCGDGGQTCNALGEGERAVTLLGQAVRIRPRIVSYEWRFGDGSSERGAAGRVAHTYGHTGVMAVSVTVTWTADYAVGGGGFRPIGGTTTTTSPVRVLPVQEAQTINHL